jgi:hypothetical protein
VRKKVAALIGSLGIALAIFGTVVLPTASTFATSQRGMAGYSHAHVLQPGSRGKVVEI